MTTTSIEGRAAVRVDGPTFARAWLAVSSAAATDPDLFHLYRAVEIEVHPLGLRLTSTNGFTLLTGWVPFLEQMGNDVDGPTGDAPAPSLAEAPLLSIVARDLDQRGRGLLRYALKLISNFPKERRSSAGLVPLDVSFGVELAPSPSDDAPLDGMAARYVALELPDAETVFVPELLPKTYPDWRAAFYRHVQLPTDAIAWSPETLARVAQVARFVPGEVRWSLNGPEGMVRMEFACLRPVVAGVAAPRRGIAPLPDLSNLGDLDDDPDDVELPLDDDTT